MTNYREILRLHSLGLNKTEIATSCQCARNTVAATLQRATNCGLQWPLPEEMSDSQLSECLFPSSISKPVYKMPDYAYVHKELQRSGVTLNLLWLEYCDRCRAAGEIPYQSTQFNKYYADYLAKATATMHLNHKPGEVMQVDWAGDTAAVVDTDTGEIIPAYVFVATLPYSGYSYVEAFFSMSQEAWTTAHVNAYKYFGGVTRIIQCDNLKTGVQKHGKDEIVLNKSYQELAEHYGTAILPARVRAPKDKAAVEGTVGIISTFILAAFRNYLREEEKSENTLEKYIRDVTAFSAFCDGTITKDTVIAYKQSLIDDGYAVRSINSMLASINSLFSFLGWYELRVKSLKVQQQVFCPEEKELTRAEHERLCRTAQQKHNERLNLILQTICGTGIRVSELQFITVESVQKGEATVSLKGKTRAIIITNDLQRKLLRYIAEQRISTDSVFVTKTGKPMSRTNIWREMKNLCREAEVNPEKVFPHNLRHLFARVFYGIEKDIAKLADILGHSSINTTRIYIISTGSEHRKRIEKNAADIMKKAANNGDYNIMRIML